MHNEITSIQLAPAAGAGLGKLIVDNLLVRPGIVQKLADALENALTATRRTWDSGAKCWVDEPDSRTQLQALFGLWAQCEGEAVKRIVHQHLGASGDLDIDSALRESPQLREQLARKLENASWHQSGRNKKAKKVEPAAEFE